MLFSLSGVCLIYFICFILHSVHLLNENSFVLQTERAFSKFMKCFLDCFIRWIWLLVEYSNGCCHIRFIQSTCFYRNYVALTINEKKALNLQKATWMPLVNIVLLSIFYFTKEQQHHYLNKWHVCVCAWRIHWKHSETLRWWTLPAHNLSTPQNSFGWRCIRGGRKRSNQQTTNARNNTEEMNPNEANLPSIHKLNDVTVCLCVGAMQWLLMCGCFSVLYTRVSEKYV